FKLSLSDEISHLAAEYGRDRAIVAWTTIDSGEERNDRRRVYAVPITGHSFGDVQLIDTAKHLNIYAPVALPIRLSVAPNGRALLGWASDANTGVDPVYAVCVAEAGPRGRFGAARQLAPRGLAGDVAIRSDGAALVLYTDGSLRAAVHGP